MVIIMYDASVVIPTYNRSKLLELTLVSLLKQDLRDMTFEIVIVDDGSNDDTKYMVDKYSRLLSINYIYHEHIGHAPSKIRNQGILAAKGSRIIFLDSGVVAGKDLIYEHCIANSPNRNSVVIGVVYALYTPTEDEEFYELFDITDIEKSLKHFRQREAYVDYRTYGYSELNYDLSLAPAPWHYFWTCNVSVPRQVLTGSVMFDESFVTWGMEDIDLGLRIFKAGIPFSIGKHAELIHIPHSPCAEFGEKNESNGRNTLIFHERHQCIESEFCYCGNDLNLNFYMKILLEAERFDFNNIDAENLFYFLEDKSILIFGGYNGSILRYIPNAHVLEYAKDYYQQLLTLLPDGTVYNCLGASTPITKEYDAVLITDFWLYINEVWLFHIIKEAMRIGRSVYLICEIMVNNNPSLFIQEEKIHELEKCLDELNQDYLVHEYEIDYIVLKVISIENKFGGGMND